MAQLPVVDPTIRQPSLNKEEAELESGALTPARDVEANAAHANHANTHNGHDADEKYATAPSKHPRADISTFQWVATLIGLYTGALLYGLDTTIAADVQASVYDRFRDIKNLPWVGLGFPMSSVAVILLVGRLYGLFNTKWLILISVFLFEVGSAVCGAAPSSNALIIGRVIAGAGGSGLYLGALTYISVFTTLAESPIYNALIGLSWGIGAILGPVVGGAFSDSSATWRWAFYINLPLAAVLLPVYVFINPSFNPMPNMTSRAKLASIDWLGAVLNGATFVLLMITLTFAGSTYAWNSASNISLWVVWGVCLIAYILQQAFCIFTTKDRRIFPVHFLRSRTMVLLYIATAAAAAANAVTLYYIPLLFQFTRGDTALKAAVRLLPFICVFIFFVMLSGGSLPKVGLYAPYYVFGGAIFLIGGSLMFAFVDDTNISIGKVYGFEILIAAGTGMVFQNAYAISASKVRAVDKANAIGFINVSQIGTIAIGLALAGVLFQNLGFNALKDSLAEYHFQEGDIRSALAGTQSAIIAGGDRKVADLVVKAVAHTISRLFGIVLASGAVTTVAGLLMRWERAQLDVVAGG